MKKFFSIFSIFVLAFTATTFVSCSGDDNDDPIVKEEEPKPQPEKELYWAVQFWASNDLLEICDIKCSGNYLTSYDFNTAMTFKNIWSADRDGKAGKLLEFSRADLGKEIYIDFTLKSNWKEIVGDRKTIFLASTYGYTLYKDIPLNFTNKATPYGDFIMDDFKDEKQAEELLSLALKSCSFVVFLN